jgi:hypothetical protein
MGWFKALSGAKKALLIFGALIAIGGIDNAVNPTSNSQQPGANISSQQRNNTSQALVKPASAQVKTVAETKAIPFQIINQNDSSLASGTSKIITPGINGVETITYKVISSNGIETGRQLLSDTVTTQPVNQISHIGTYVAPTCPNGTYVNTYGNTVCSPYSAPSAPAGASAQCVDGTYSFSQSRRGTCSHHGGVSTWL